MEDLPKGPSGKVNGSRIIWYDLWRDGNFFITRKLAHLQSNKGAQVEENFLSYIFPSDDLSILVFMMGTFFCIPEL